MDEDVKTIHITKALTSAIIVDLIEEYPNLEIITCSPSVYNRTSSRYIEALSQLDIDVKIKYNWGAKSQTDGQEFEVLEMSREGLNAREISQKLGISLNRVYYLLRKTHGRFDNYKRKHDHDEVKASKNEGLSVREISEKLDIPKRTVYYILNNK